MHLTHHNLSHAASPGAGTMAMAIPGLPGPQGVAAFPSPCEVEAARAEQAIGLADAAWERAGFAPVHQRLHGKPCPRSASHCVAPAHHDGDRRVMASASLRGVPHWTGARVQGEAHGPSTALPLDVAARAVNQAVERYAALFPAPRGPASLDIPPLAACPPRLQAELARGRADLFLADGADFRAQAGSRPRGTLAVLRDRFAVLVNPHRFLRKDEPVPRAAAVGELLAHFVNADAVERIGEAAALAGIPRDQLLHALHAHVMGEPRGQLPANAPAVRARLAAIDLGALLRALHEDDGEALVRCVLPADHEARLGATSLLNLADDLSTVPPDARARDRAMGSLKSAVADILAHEPPRLPLARRLSRLLGEEARRIVRDAMSVNPAPEALRRLALAHALDYAHDAVRAALPASIGHFDLMAHADVVLNFVDGSGAYRQHDEAPASCGKAGPMPDRGTLALLNTAPHPVAYELYQSRYVKAQGPGRGGADALAQDLEATAKSLGPRSQRSPAGRECILVHAGLDTDLDWRSQRAANLRDFARFVAMGYMGPVAVTAARSVAARQDDAPPVDGLVSAWVAERVFPHEPGRNPGAIALVDRVIAQRARFEGRPAGAVANDILSLLFRDESFQGAENLRALARLHDDFAAQAGPQAKAWTLKPAAGSPSAARAGAS